MNKLLTKEFFDEKKAKLLEDPSFAVEKQRNEEALVRFKTKYGSQALDGKSDEELVHLLFQDGSNNNDNLYHTLAFDNSIIVALTSCQPQFMGAAYLSTDKNPSNWYDARLNPTNLEYAKNMARIVKTFVSEVTAIVGFRDQYSTDDLYDKINEKLTNLFNGINFKSRSLYGKYLACLFPDIFPPFHNDVWQKALLEDEYDEDNICSNYKKIKKIMDDVGIDDPVLFGKCIWGNQELKKNFDNYWILRTDSNIFSFSQHDVGHIEPFTAVGSDGRAKKYFKSVKRGEKMLVLETSEPRQFIGVAVANGVMDRDANILNIQLKEKFDKPIPFEKIKGKSYFSDGCFREPTTLSKVSEKVFADIYGMRNEVSESIRSDSIKASNKLFYGIPGCGKSFEVDKFIKEKLNIDDNSYRKIRTTFYLDCSYNDFVRQIMPKTKNDKLVYEVNPGPFTNALWAAYLDPNLPVALVIEEINRGNAPAIFGDIFQLLDRDDNGESTYSITNPIITQYFDECGLDKMPGNRIKLPKNLYIFATMNSSDQNVFKLDTAFKRRWEMIRMTNASTKSDAKQFNDFNIPGTSTSWVDFVDNVNKKILETGLNEDRQLGYWFLIKKSLAGFNEEEQKTIFANKVLEYLWNDVLKFHEKDILFRSDINTFDDLITVYIKHPKEVFADGVLNEQESQDQSEGE